MLERWNISRWRKLTILTLYLISRFYAAVSREVFDSRRWRKRVMLRQLWMLEAEDGLVTMKIKL